MSISRKNWSALSSLARQWTVEDEEEVEREKIRRMRDSSTDSHSTESPTEETEPQSSSVGGSAEAGDTGGGLEQLQMDFVEMLRVRDERRRIRHVETLRRQGEGEGGGTTEDSLDEEPHVELLGEKQDGGNIENVQSCVEALMTPEPSTISEEDAKLNNESRNQDSAVLNPTKSSHKCLSSLSVSFGKNPSSPPANRVVSPLSPRSPPNENRGAEQPVSPYSPTHSGTVSPTPNGDTEMMKEEEENMSLQRSASVRIAAFESSKEPNQEDEQKSPFQRNSRQRISSRSIQEKMERLAQSSQKWELSKSPTVLKSVCLADEVSRKRELFERDQEGSEKINVFSKQDFRNFSYGISDRINQWVQKKTFTVSLPHSPSDLRNVNISSKKSLFERGPEQGHK